MSWNSILPGPSRPKRQKRSSNIPCDICDLEFGSWKKLRTHNNRHHKCIDCALYFPSRKKHKPNCQHKGERRAHHVPTDLTLGVFTKQLISHNGLIMSFTFKPPSLMESLDELFNHIYEDLVSLLTQLLAFYKTITNEIRIAIRLESIMVNKKIDTVLGHPAHTIYDESEISEFVSDAFDLLVDQLEHYNEGQSAWSLSKIHFFDISVADSSPLVYGASYKLPRQLTGRRGLLGMPVPDGFCFQYAVVSSLHHKEIPEENRKSRCKYDGFIGRYNWNGVSFPTKMHQIKNWERDNQIGVNVFHFQNYHIYPVRVLKTNYSKMADILISSTDKNAECKHFIGISSISKLSPNGTHHKLYYCRSCMHGFHEKPVLEKHIPMCLKLTKSNQKIVLPSIDGPPSLRVNKFDNYSNLLKLSYYCIADLESFLLPLPISLDESSGSLTYPQFKDAHLPSSAYMVLIGPEDTVIRTFFSDEEDCMERMIRCMLSWADFVLNEIKTNNAREMTEEEAYEHRNSLECPLCHTWFDYDQHKRCLHHHHQRYNSDETDEDSPLRSNYLNTICTRCNIFIKQKKRLNCYFHNGKRYDIHHIIKNLFATDVVHVKALGKNTQQIMQLELDKKVCILDSFNQLPHALSVLAEHLMKDGMGKFRVSKSLMPSYLTDEELKKYIFRKQVFPYQSLKDRSCFEKIGIGPREAFFDVLNQQQVSDEDYAQCQKFYDLMKCRNLRDLSKWYLILDVAITADCLINYSCKFHKLFDLDPLTFISLPSFTIATLRYNTRSTKIDLLTDMDHYLIACEMKRGGLNLLNTREVFPNDPRLPNFDPSKQTSELIFLDCNSLYSTVMLGNMPVGNYRTLDEDQLRTFSLSNYGGRVGCFVKADLEMDPSINWTKKYYQLPLVCSRESIPFNELSETQINCLKTTMPGLDKYKPAPKLLSTFWEKKGHWIDYEELIFALEHGVKMTKLEAVVEYDQEPLYADFVQKVLDMKANATSDLERQLVKIFLNAMWGRHLLDRTNYNNLVIATCEEEYRKNISKHTLKSFYEVDSDITMFTHMEPVVHIRELLFVGCKILSGSKLYMRRLFYEEIQRVWGVSNVHLHYLDTDGMVLEFFWQSTCEHLQKWGELAGILDGSSFDESDFRFSSDRKGQAGLLKSEVGSFPIASFVGSAIKKYMVKLYDADKDSYFLKLASKSLPKCYLQKMGFDEFRKSIHTEAVKSFVTYRIMAFQNQLFTIAEKKIALNNFYSARKMVNFINTVPYGCRYTYEEIQSHSYVVPEEEEGPR